MNIGRQDATGDENEIYQVRNGIILKSSACDIANTEFHDFQGETAKPTEEPILDLNQFGIYSSKSTSRIKHNSFLNLQKGIYAEDSFEKIIDNEMTISISENSFKASRGISVIRPQSCLIDNNNVTDAWRAISLEQVNTPFKVINNILNRPIHNNDPINFGIYIGNLFYQNNELGLVKNNTINVVDGNFEFGIYLTNVNHVLVDQNTFNYNTDEGQDEQNRPIGIAGGQGNFIRRNSIIGSSNYLGIDNSGMEVAMSSDNKIECNGIDYFHSGILINTSNTNTQIARNDFYEANIALLLKGPTNIGSQVDNLNEWLGSYAGLNDHGAFILSNFPANDANWNRFFVDSNDDNDYLPPKISPANFWFIDRVSNTEPILGCEATPIHATNNPDTLVSILRSNYDFSVFNDEMTWMKKADIFEMILADPDLHSVTVLDSFYDADEDEPLGQLVKWQMDLASRFGAEYEEKQLSLDTICNFLNAIAYFDSILLLKHSDTITMRAKRAVKVDSLNLKIDHWTDLLDYEELTSQDSYYDLELELKEFTPTNDLEEYMQQGLLYKCQVLLGIGLDEEDSTDIYYLANLCPWQGGRAIPIVDELYTSISDSLISISDTNCSYLSPLILQSEIVDADASNIFTTLQRYQLSLIDENVLTPISKLILSDITGKVIREYQSIYFDFTIDLYNVPPGIYILNGISKSNKNFNQFIFIK